MHNIHCAESEDELLSEFKQVCNHWTLMNIGLQQELKALDYGLCGILSAYQQRLEMLEPKLNNKHTHTKMEEYVDDILTSAPGFSHIDKSGKRYLGISQKSTTLH